MAEQVTEEAGTISADQAARLIKCTTQWLRQLVKNGYITPVGKARYNLVNVVHGYIDHLKDDERRTSKSAAENEVRAERAREIKMRNDERQRLVIPVEEATEAMDYLVGKVRTVLSGIPATASRDLDLRRKIEAACNAGQKEIGDAALAASDLARTGKPLPYNSSPN